ncbi:MAG TPA: TIGR00730 family Rossman fold protein [Miltoncostaeales bacterium]|nr:TIGR00730 family Rossman fold protein [Miltoncostaeales bacterium]
MRIAIFTGSAVGAKETYTTGAAQLASHLAKEGHAIVYGGGKVGLMGVVADAALAAGGEVIGVTPKTLVEREVAHHGVTRLEVVDTMHERKARMVDLADAMVALPGGVGTLDELFEAWTWQLLGIHSKPVALYDIDDYWAPMRSLLDQIVAERFLGEEHLAALIQETDPDALIDAISRWSPPTQKWISPTPTE